MSETKYTHIFDQEVPLSLLEAMSNIQLEMVQANIKKSGYSEYGNYHYVTLDDLLNALLPIANKHGVTITQITTDVHTERTDLYNVQTLLSNKDGAVLFPGLALTAVANKRMSTAQESGSAITYARRYTLTAIFCIPSDEDVDATPKGFEKATPTDYQQQAIQNKGNAVKSLLGTVTKYANSSANQQNKTIAEIKNDICRKANVNDIGSLNVQQLNSWTEAIQAKMRRKEA